MMSPLARAGLATGLLVVPVALEILISDLSGQTWGELVFAGSQVLGWLLVFSVCRELDREGPSRPARIGRRLLLAAVVCQVGFGLAYGGLAATGVATGGAFLLFALAFLLLTAAGLTWGVSLVRRRHREVGWALVSAAGLGLLAIAVPVDPFHDAFLLGSYLAWLPVGHAATRPSGDREPALSAASR